MSDRHKGQPLNVRLEGEIMDALRDIAVREDRPVTTIIKRSLAAYARLYGHPFPIAAPGADPIPTSPAAPPAP